jgi:hypothetical protein
MRVRLYVDNWDPSYSLSLEQGEVGPTGESTAQLGVDAELPAASWRPLGPAADVRSPDMVLLVDGVRRVDARVWVEEADGVLHPGLAASYAAGVVRCDLRRGSAEVAGARIARGLFTSSPNARDVLAGNTRYAVRRVAVGEPAQLSAAVQPCLHRLEAEVSVEVRSGGSQPADPTSPAVSQATGGEADLLVIDGPLRGCTQLPRTLGYVKTHRVHYLPRELSTVIGALRPGQRSPVFLLGTTWHRYTWYLKLPGPPGSPWAGVVRVEASADLPRGEVIRLADVSLVTLPRFASTAYKDPRAPQNLTPVAGLERRLRTMLGDPRLLLRSLMAAAAARPPAA